MDQGFRRDYLLRLPLPLAQLYSRAHNAKDNRTRHDNCFYIFESLIKLSACPLIGCYLDDLKRGRPHVEAVDKALSHLALPSLGQWVGMLRELARHYGESETAKGHPLRLVWRQLNRKHSVGDSPGIVGLFRRIKHGPDGKLSAATTCTLLDLFDSIVRYRNDVVGHGGPRFDAFFENEMGPLMFPAVNEVLAERTFEPLGPPGTRLVYLTEMRMIEEGKFEVAMRELVGLQGERSAPMVFDGDLAEALSPRFGSFPGLALIWPGQPAPLRLGPMMRFRESEVADEVLLLNRDRGGRQVEYLSYTTGRTERDAEMAGAMAAILSAIADRTITEDDVRAFEKHSRSESESVEGLMGDSRLTRGHGTMLGDYELLAELGRGGMGVVYLARQASLGRVVALKTLPGDLSSDERALARFRREMRVLGNCEHPNIVKLLDSGTLADGQMYYTMEYVPGADLEQVWKQLSKSTADADVTTLAGSAFTAALHEASRGKRADVKTRYQRTMSPLLRRALDEGDEPIELPPLPLPELPESPEARVSVLDQAAYVRRVVELIRDAARALHTVHEQGVIHRDVSPGNLMLTPDGMRIVLMDFGLAKGSGATQSVSIGAGFMGKLRYAAPEQLASAVLDVGPPADVRGLGATLWELVTRRRLFDEAGDERALASMIHQKDVPRLREIDPGFDRDLEAIVARATEREIDKRIGSAEELADYLELYLAGEPLPIRPPTTGELVRRWVRKRKGLVASVLVLVVLLSAMLGWFYKALDQKADEALAAQREADDARIAAQQSAERLRESQTRTFQIITNSEFFRGTALYGPQRALLDQLVEVYRDTLRETGFDASLALDLAQTLRKLAEVNLDIAESNRSSASAQALTAQPAAQTLEAQQQADEALKLLDDAAMPDSFAARYERAMVRKSLARVYQNNQQYHDALAELDASIETIDFFLRSSAPPPVSTEALLSAQAEALRLQGELNLALANVIPANADQYLGPALEAFATAETIQLGQFDADQPDRVLASELAAVKLKIAETLERMGASADAHIVYTSVINNVFGLFSMDAEDPARRLTLPMQLDLAIAKRKDAAYLGIKERRDYLAESVRLLESIARANPDRLRYQIEYARSLLELASHDPLTDRQKRENPEAVTLDRYEREQDFNALFDLLTRLNASYPDDPTITDLLNQAIAARAQFEGAELDPAASSG
ncbi:MAG: serine/threonine protein kinase [Phycisphaeraceae bacterium]